MAKAKMAKCVKRENERNGRRRQRRNESRQLAAAVAKRTPINALSTCAPLLASAENEKKRRK